MSTTTSITAAPPATMAEFLERFGSKAVMENALRHIEHGARRVLQGVEGTGDTDRRPGAAHQGIARRLLLKYAGTWQSDATYAEGRLTTHGGGLWLAMNATDRQPGTEASGWRLIVEEGARVTAEAVLAERLELWRELEALALDLLVIEAREGSSPPLEDCRRRMLTVRATVREQLRALLTPDHKTIH